MMTLTPVQLKQLGERGIDTATVEQQLERFSTGFPSLEIEAAATPGNGITILTEAEQEGAEKRWQMYLADGGTVVKFVPASGAASRMFKALFEFADGDTDEAAADSPVGKLLAALDKLPFKADLDAVCTDLHGKDAGSLLAEGRRRDVIAAIIRPEGLNYGQLPKGLLKFHSYEAGSRTPLEEHLMEGAQTASDANGIVRLHFTVSANHVELFRKEIARAVPAMEASTGKHFEISLSIQQPRTDTVAANPDGTPFTVEEGKLLFRPGGHGALIANLSEQSEAVVFIKNIDNVVPDSRRDSTVAFKRVIAGYLMELRDKVVAYRRTMPPEWPMPRSSPKWSDSWPRHSRSMCLKVLVNRRRHWPHGSTIVSTAPCVCVVWCVMKESRAAVRSSSVKPTALPVFRSLRAIRSLPSMPTLPRQPLTSIR